MLLTLLLVYVAGGFIVWEYISRAKQRNRNRIAWALIGGGVYLCTVAVVGRMALVPIAQALWGEDPNIAEVWMLGMLVHILSAASGIGVSYLVLNKFLGKLSKTNR